MSTYIKSAFPSHVHIFGFVFFVAWAQPAQAEKIVAMIDDHGHKIYVNAPEIVAPVRGARAYRPSRSASSMPLHEVDKLVVQAAAAKQVDPKLVHSIIQVESAYDPNAVSRKGAMGLMQLIPGTAKRFGVENPFDPGQNIHGGVSYLKYLLDMFRGDVTLSLAAYNAGENSVLRYGGVPAFQETQEYVRKVNNLYGSDFPAGEVPRKTAAPPKPGIYRHVDAQGVVHYTNGQEF